MNEITHPQLVLALVKNPVDILNGLSFHSIDLWHAATGISGECTELLEGVLLYNTHQRSLHELHGHAMEELGDIEFYMEQLRQRLGWQRANIGADDTTISPDMLLRHTAEVAIHGGHILDQIKKVAVYGKQLDEQALTIHMAGLDAAMDAVRLSLGISREQTLAHNIGKLSVRYKDLQYSDAGASERADKAGHVPERKYFGKEPAPGAPLKVAVDSPPGNPDE